MREVKLLSFEGKTIPKKDLKEIDEEAKITDPEAKEIYEKFVKYENILLLKTWTDDHVTERYAELRALITA